MKVAIRTFGCSLNQADSEAIAGILKQKEYLIVPEEEAEIVIINSCTVKNRAEQKFFKSIRELEEQGKMVILAGCVPQADPTLRRTKLKDYSIIGTNHLEDVADVIERTRKGEVVHEIKKAPSAGRVALPSLRSNPLVEIIPISEGCLDSCSYCKTKHARGNQLSYRPREIVERAKNAIAQGVKEIWLTSQDCGSYGLDIGVTISDLLEELVELSGEHKIRLGMANPTYLPQQLNRLIALLQHPRMFQFLHIPVQAGDDTVLADMNRQYTVSQFKDVVSKVRDAIPSITIATDIICGFPTESETQFENTLALLNELKIEIVNISRFWPRPNTPAALLHKHDGAVTLARSQKLVAVYNEYRKKQLASYVGSIQEIIWTQKRAGVFLGRTQNYTLVESTTKGSKIMGVESHHLVS